MRIQPIVRIILVAVAMACCGGALSDPGSRAALLESYRAASSAGNAIAGGVLLRSSEGEDRPEGVAYALIGHPFSQVRAALTDAGNWCDILTLHLNV
jgi:hypothetical protein